MFNHKHTILLITRQVLARIDLSGRKRLSVKQIWTAAGSDYDNLLPEVSRAIKLGNRRPGRVTIVSPEFWTGVLSIPTDVVAIANEQEIIQALALEAEVESGLSAFDSRTHAVRITEVEDRSDECQWCVSQIPIRHLQELSSTLRACGTKLHGLAHPVVAQLVLSSQLSEQLAVETVQGRLDSWREQLTLTVDEIQSLASAWAVCVSQAPAHPLLVLSELESGAAKSQPVALTATLALLSAGGCGLWHWQTQKSLAMTTQAIEQFEKQQSQREATEAALKSAEAAVTQLRLEVQKNQATRIAAERQIQLAGAVHSLHSRRWLALVDALAESASENCWVQKLESSSVQTVIHGLALDNAAANGFAGRLELALKGSGWRATPAATSLTSRNLIAFKIVLKAILKPDDGPATSSISLKQDLLETKLELAGVIEP
jgi:hypothetical protein